MEAKVIVVVTLEICLQWCTRGSVPHSTLVSINVHRDTEDFKLFPFEVLPFSNLLTKTFIVRCSFLQVFFLWSNTHARTHTHTLGVVMCWARCARVERWRRLAPFLQTAFLCRDCRCVRTRKPQERKVKKKQTKTNKICIHNCILKVFVSSVLNTMRRCMFCCVSCFRVVKKCICVRENGCDNGTKSFVFHFYIVHTQTMQVVVSLVSRDCVHCVVFSGVGNVQQFSTKETNFEAHNMVKLVR